MADRSPDKWEIERDWKENYEGENEVWTDSV